AERVQAIVGTAPKPDDYWWTATIGEVFLIRQMYDDAARLYGAAVAMARSKTGNHKTTWIQACRLLRKLNPSDDQRARIRQVFSPVLDCREIAGDRPSLGPTGIVIVLLSVAL